jgi:glutaredoxin
MAKLLLFTSTTCPKCPAAKQLIKTHNLDCDIVEVGKTPGGENKALQAGVRSVPQFVIKEGAMYRFVDLEDENSFEEMKSMFQLVE